MFNLVAKLKIYQLWRLCLPSVLLACAASYFLFVGGCDNAQKHVLHEEEETMYIRGQEDYKRGHIDDALNNFSRVIEKRKDAPESHLSMGLIYLENKDDPISAIYHFKKFLELKPATDYSDKVRNRIHTAQMRYASTLPGNPYNVDRQNLNLEDLLKQARAENLELKQELAKANSAIATLQRAQQNTQTAQPNPVANNQNSGRQNRQQATPPAPAPQRQAATISTYTIQAGDTLSSVSRKVYGTPNRWKEIYEKNKDTMSSPSALRPGQVLKIP